MQKSVIRSDPGVPMCADRTSSPENQGVKSAAAILHELHWGQRILLVGGDQFRQSLRASILRAHALQVDVARILADSRPLWQRHTYDWVFLDVHSRLPGEVMDFCEQLRRMAPRQRIAFFVGPPTYVSTKWPSEEITEDKRKEGRAAELRLAA
jgi:CheY-like chemotaxis protein